MPAFSMMYAIIALLLCDQFSGCESAKVAPICANDQLARMPDSYRSGFQLCFYSGSDKPGACLCPSDSRSNERRDGEITNNA